MGKAKPQQDQPQDEHAGHGGSYVIDPATGRRSLVHRTDHPDTVAKAADDQPQPKE